MSVSLACIQVHLFSQWQNGFTVGMSQIFDCMRDEFRTRLALWLVVTRNCFTHSTKMSDMKPSKRLSCSFIWAVILFVLLSFLFLFYRFDMIVLLWKWYVTRWTFLWCIHLYTSVHCSIKIYLYPDLNFLQFYSAPVFFLAKQEAALVDCYTRLNNTHEMVDYIKSWQIGLIFNLWYVISLLIYYTFGRYRFVVYCVSVLLIHTEPH